MRPQRGGSWRADRVPHVLISVQMDALHAAVLKALEAAATGGGGGGLGTVLYVDAGAAEALHGSAPLRTLLQRGFSAVLPLADAHNGAYSHLTRV